ncbi:hypothetical protein CKM354_000901700 [Cercospora kikuchii]|uniref:Uncharacterized protein n=1 Tax=Cercospora kikuchii TaxID=84275 RepID=A0A9P3FJS0_9PEZI|nr:uncharacterized protein CKM354_000901700 [Cercospora kikuchii]GIZ45869.1 hypothetical protein CKM354_000901700 [Cercospora kikuchii]
MAPIMAPNMALSILCLLPSLTFGLSTDDKVATSLDRRQVGAIEALGAIGTGLGIIDFIKSNFAPEAEPEGTIVTIKAGRSDPGDNPNDLNGTISAAFGYNSGNQFIGQSSGTFVDNGGVAKVVIDQRVSGQQATFVSLAAGNDGICISWIAVGFVDDTEGGAWTGDIGKECGQRWTFGKESAGTIPNGGGEYVPHCTWLDSDFTDGTMSASMKFRTRAYGADVRATLEGGRACQSTIFGRDEGPIGAQPAKRDVPERPQWLVDELVISSIPGQTAEELCSSETSWGEDFIGVDGKFCDMGIKQLIPLCSEQDVDGCIDIAEADKTLSRRSSVARRQLKIAHKTYKKVTRVSL